MCVSTIAGSVVRVGGQDAVKQLGPDQCGVWGCECGENKLAVIVNAHRANGRMVQSTILVRCEVL